MVKKDIGKLSTETLRSFQAAAPGVAGSAVVSVDGSAIASELPTSVAERRVCAMSAAMWPWAIKRPPSSSTAELVRGVMTE